MLNQQSTFTRGDFLIPCSLFALFFSLRYSVLHSYTNSFWIFFLFRHLSPCSFNLVSSSFQFFVTPTHIIEHLVLLFSSLLFSCLLLSLFLMFFFITGCLFLNYWSCSSYRGLKKIKRRPVHFLTLPPFHVSPVIQLIPGASAPAALPANHGWAALPVQAFWQHREHHRRRRRAPLATRPSSLPKPQVRAWQVMGKRLFK